MRNAKLSVLPPDVKTVTKDHPTINKLTKKKESSTFNSGVKIDKYSEKKLEFTQAKDKVSLQKGTNSMKSRSSLQNTMNRPPSDKGTKQPNENHKIKTGFNVEPTAKENSDNNIQNNEVTDGNDAGMTMSNLNQEEVLERKKTVFSPFRQRFQKKFQAPQTAVFAFSGSGSASPRGKKQTQTNQRDIFSKILEMLNDPKSKLSTTPQSYMELTTKPQIRPTSLSTTPVARLSTSQLYIKEPQETTYSGIGSPDFAMRNTEEEKTTPSVIILSAKSNKQVGQPFQFTWSSMKNTKERNNYDIKKRDENLDRKDNFVIKDRSRYVTTKDTDAWNGNINVNKPAASVSSGSLAGQRFTPNRPIMNKGSLQSPPRPVGDDLKDMSKIRQSKLLQKLDITFVGGENSLHSSAGYTGKDMDPGSSFNTKQLDETIIGMPRWPPKVAWKKQAQFEQQKEQQIEWASLDKKKENLQVVLASTNVEKTRSDVTPNVHYTDKTNPSENNMGIPQDVNYKSISKRGGLMPPEREKNGIIRDAKSQIMGMQVILAGSPMEKTTISEEVNVNRSSSSLGNSIPSISSGYTYHDSIAIDRGNFTSKKLLLSRPEKSKVLESIQKDGILNRDNMHRSFPNGNGTLVSIPKTLDQRLVNKPVNNVINGTPVSIPSSLDQRLVTPQENTSIRTPSTLDQRLVIQQENTSISTPSTLDQRLVTPQENTSIRTPSTLDQRVVAPQKNTSVLTGNESISSVQQVNVGEVDNVNITNSREMKVNISTIMEIASKNTSIPLVMKPQNSVHMTNNIKRANENATLNSIVLNGQTGNVMHKILDGNAFLQQSKSIFETYIKQQENKGANTLQKKDVNMLQTDINQGNNFKKLQDLLRKLAAIPSPSNNGIPQRNGIQPQLHNGIPQVNVIPTTFTNGVPQANAIPPPLNNGMPQVNAIPPNFKNGMPQANAIRPPLNNGIPQTNAIPPTFNNGMPQVNAIPSTFYNGIPQANAIPPTFNNGMSQANAIQSPLNSGMPQSNAIPPLNRGIPQANAIPTPFNNGIPQNNAIPQPFNNGFPQVNANRPPFDNGIPQTFANRPPLNNGVPQANANQQPFDNGVLKENVMPTAFSSGIPQNLNVPKPDLSNMNLAHRNPSYSEWININPASSNSQSAFQLEVAPPGRPAAVATTVAPYPIPTTMFSNMNANFQNNFIAAPTTQIYPPPPPNDVYNNFDHASGNQLYDVNEQQSHGKGYSQGGHKNHKGMMHEQHSGYASKPKYPGENALGPNTNRMYQQVTPVSSDKPWMQRENQNVRYSGNGHPDWHTNDQSNRQSNEPLNSRIAFHDRKEQGHGMMNHDGHHKPHHNHGNADPPSGQSGGYPEQSGGYPAAKPPPQGYADPPAGHSGGHNDPKYEPVNIRGSNQFSMDQPSGNQQFTIRQDPPSPADAQPPGINQPDRHQHDMHKQEKNHQPVANGNMNQRNTKEPSGGPKNHANANKNVDNKPNTKDQSMNNRNANRPFRPFWGVTPPVNPFWGVTPPMFFNRNRQQNAFLNRFSQPNIQQNWVRNPFGFNNFANPFPYNNYRNFNVPPTPPPTPPVETTTTKYDKAQDFLDTFWQSKGGEKKFDVRFFYLFPFYAYFCMSSVVRKVTFGDNFVRRPSIHPYRCLSTL